VLKTKEIWNLKWDKLSVTCGCGPAAALSCQLTKQVPAKTQQGDLVQHSLTKLLPQASKCLTPLTQASLAIEVAAEQCLFKT
jgi:hypothetical protein